MRPSLLQSPTAKPRDGNAFLFLREGHRRFGLGDFGQ